MGHLRPRPAGEVLLAHKGGTEAAGQGTRRLAAPVGGDFTRDTPGLN